MTKKHTPMIKQFLDVKEKHPDKIVLFRMGDFYETFFEDAKITARILGITLTSRNKKKEDSIPLAGFPYHALKNYLPKLLKQKIKVVICEQTEDPKKAKGLVKREVVDILTPGSIIDNEYIDQKENNFLTGIYLDNNVGIANLDISTGEFNFTEVAIDDFANEIFRLTPQEIIVPDDKTHEFLLEKKIDIPLTITQFDDPYFDKKEAKNILKNFFSVNNIEGLSARSAPNGAFAGGLVLAYIKSLKKDVVKHISSLRYYSLDKFMKLDETTRRNLEIFRSMRYGNKFGTLISILDKTKTAMGSRFLKEELSRPLITKNEIENRLDIVEEFNEKIELNSDVRNILQEIGDLSRILGKIGSNRINPREVLTLKHYLQTAPKLRNKLEDFNSQIINNNFVAKFKDYSEIVVYLEKAIIENPSLKLTDGKIIEKGFNEQLDELKSISSEGKHWIAKLEDEEKQKTGINSLKIGYNRVFGYYIEVRKSSLSKVPEHYIAKQTLTNSQRFITEELKNFEAKVLSAEEKIKSLEYELFTEVREYLLEKIEYMQKFVSLIAEIDFYSNYAHIAYKNRYVRPNFSNDNSLNLKNSRHPVIEELVEEEEYIPNDASLDDHKNKIALITGPNMAGKSTYLRQIGLISLIAQSGGFIPADEADLPIFDKIFTRVGASDNLAQGQSTFLVEMIETANILNSATPKSLILLDEIGRGTSTFDGLSLAWAIVEYIHNNKKLMSKTLFATHYHELTELENVLKSVKNYNIAIKNWKDKIIFLRKIERGPADQSYGIDVAKLAGIPNKVISRAKKILKNLESQELSPNSLSQNAKKDLEDCVKEEQLDIFDVVFEKSQEQNHILDEIKEVDLNNLTPLEALNFLSDLKKTLK